MAHFVSIHYIFFNVLRGLSPLYSTNNVGGGGGVFNMEEKNHSQSWQLFPSLSPEKYDFWPLAGCLLVTVPNHRYNSTNWPRICLWGADLLGQLPKQYHDK